MTNAFERPSGRCQNPQCREVLDLESQAFPKNFCPACRLVMRVGFRAGSLAVAAVAFAAGVLVALVEFFR